jgi:excisionase family DNA binding protein
VVQDIVTSTTVAKLAHVSRETVHQWVRDGRLPSTRTPTGLHLFRRDEVMAFLRQRRAEALARYSLDGDDGEGVIRGDEAPRDETDR